MLNRTAVATSTNAATVTSIVADRFMANAAVSLPSAGRCRRQFHAPSTKTIATRHNFTMSVMPYGDNHRFDKTWMCFQAIMTPNSTSTGAAHSASGEPGELIEQQPTGDDRAYQPDHGCAMSRVSENAPTRCVDSRSLCSTQRPSQHGKTKADCSSGQERPDEADVLRDRLWPVNERLCLHAVP